MSFRGDPQTTEDHIAFIYELLRKLRPPNNITQVVQQIVSGLGIDCPCPVNIRVCVPGGPDYGEDFTEMQ